MRLAQVVNYLGRMSQHLSIRLLSQITKDTNSGRLLWALATLNEYPQTPRELREAVLAPLRHALTSNPKYCPALIRKIGKKLIKGLPLGELNHTEQRLVRTLERGRYVTHRRSAEWVVHACARHHTARTHDRNHSRVYGKAVPRVHARENQ